EKVGKDLHSQSEKGMLADLPDLFTGIAASDKRYRLVHPWEEGAEETGGFPLTGSTFEVLCALSGQKRLEAQGSERRLPAFICFASPKEVLDAENDEDAPWGSHRLWDATYEAFKGEKRRLRREQDALSLQRQKLANFARYLTLAGYELRFLSKREEIEEAYRKWIVDNEFAAPSDALEIDPFIGLRSYDVTEHAVYFGREDEVKAVSSIIESIFEKAEAPNCYWVKGASGVGKSSFLRAGLIGELVNSYFSIGRYAYIVFRPNELLSKAALDGLSDPLQAMFSLALEQIYRFFQAETYHPPDFNDYAKTYYDLRPEARGNWVLRTLDYVVAQLQPEGADLPFRLLIGIDQFEEIVDMLFDEARNEQWSSFVDFMTVAPTGQRVFVLSTLRQKRLEKMRKHPGLGPLWERSSRNQYELRLPSRKDFRQIIERSFRLVGHSFPSEDLVNHILSQIDAIQMKEEGRRVGRVMPLLSNALQQLHEQVGEVEWGKANKKNRDGRDRRENREASNEMNLVAAPKASGKKQVKITLELAKQHASLEKAMQYLPSLVAEAMQEYRLNAKLGSQDSTLDDLFRKLVRWTGGREDGDTQFSLPTIQMPSHGDEAVLARALKKQRLLTDEGDGLVRLAHETVLKEWPEAAQFIDRERPLYLLAQEMRADALRWLVRREIDQTKVEEFADIACDMLGLWAQRFHEFFTPQLDPEDIMLRDYCLALMKRVCTPRAVIEKTQFKSTHLHIASLYGRADILREMLERDRDAVNLQRSDDRTAIMTPGFVSDHEVLDTLLAFEADVNSADKDGYVPLHFAAIGGDVAFTRKLIEAGAKIPDVPAHPIHTAAQHDKTDVVSYYLKTHGVGADIRTKMGWTPIMCAAAENKCAALEILADRADLNATIDPDAEKPFGMTALHIAAANGALDFAKALLDQGVPLNQADRGGATALHYAVQHDQPNTVRFLADRMEKAGGDGGNP
ncbi:MAG: ankyrin repeat domain-containing protein, partial [Pseudomonadota bacterium]